MLAVYSDPDGLRGGRLLEDILPTLIRDYVRPGRLRLELAPVDPPAGPVELAPQRSAARDVLAAAEQNRAWNYILRYAAAGSGAYDAVLARRVAGGIKGLDVARWNADARSAGVRRQAEDFQRNMAARGETTTPVLRLDVGTTGEGVTSIDVLRTPTEDVMDQIKEAYGY